MSVHEFLSRFEHDSVTVTVYSPEPATPVLDRLASPQVEVTWTRLPAPQEEGFVVIHKSGDFAGTVPLGAVWEFLREPLVTIDESDLQRSDPDRQRLFTSLANTLLSTLTPAQLLATSYEFEDRAYRVGKGTLRVSFQSLSTFRTQCDRYETLAGDTDLDVHIYGQAGWDPPDISSVTVHPLTGGTLADVWLLAFDAAGDASSKCALLAVETEPRQFRGFWTYDPTLVDEILSAVETVDG